VINECLEYALENHVDHGVWGGKSERERRRLSRMRRRIVNIDFAS
jgi:WhiB family redox-sensing transcriptional regulator